MAAHFLCASGLAAQEVTFRTEDNAVSVLGRFLAYDGEAATVLGPSGPVTFDATGMLCEGEGCPNLANYVPQMRIVAEPRVGEVLIPALVDVFGRDKGWTLEGDDGALMLVSDAGPELSFALSLAGTEAAYDAFLAHDADALVTLREAPEPMRRAAYEAGLGRLETARQARILALDALVPVTAPGGGNAVLSMSEMAEALSGGGDGFEVHLPDTLEGPILGFEDRILAPVGLELAAPDVAHEDAGAVAAAVARSERGLSLLPYGRTGNAQPLALSGPCGLQVGARYLTLKTEDYPLTFPIYLYLPQRQQHPLIQEFVDWLRSPSAQLVIRRAGFVDLAAVPIPLAQQGDRLANAIARAGEEVPLGELQRMMRVLQPRVRMSSTFRFEPGSTRLDGQSRSNVYQLAQAIRDGRFGGREILFVGFSDGRGPAEANRDLSAARAEAVMRDVTAALGGDVPGNVVLDTEAFGEALPMACDDSLWGQQTNRRVELWVRDLP